MKKSEDEGEAVEKKAVFVRSYRARREDGRLGVRGQGKRWPAEEVAAELPIGAGGGAGQTGQHIGHVQGAGTEDRG